MDTVLCLRQAQLHNGNQLNKEKKMRLFKQAEQDVFARLDELMVRMASDETYDEYIVIRGGMNNGR